MSKDEKKPAARAQLHVAAAMSGTKDFRDAVVTRAVMIPHWRPD